MYREQYDDYAGSKNSYYTSGKFNPISPWGFRNFVREKVIVHLVHQNLGTNGTVLDLGCAAGHTTTLIASSLPTAKVIGIDIATPFIQAATEINKLANLTFIAGEIGDLPAGVKFDCVVLAEVLEHLPNDLEFLYKIGEVLNSRGFLLITTPNLNGDGTLNGRLQRIFKLRKFTPATSFDAVNTASHGDQHVREYDFRQLQRILDLAGFESFISGCLILDHPGKDLSYRVLRRIFGFQFIQIYSRIEVYLSLKFPKIGKVFGRHLICIARHREHLS